MSEFWTGTWTLLLSAGLFLFSALAVIVASSGLVELRKLRRQLHGRAARAPERPAPTGHATADAPSDPAGDT